MLSIAVRAPRANMLSWLKKKQKKNSCFRKSELPVKIVFVSVVVMKRVPAF